MKPTFSRTVVLGIIIILIGSLSCSLTQKLFPQSLATTSTVPPVPTATGNSTINGPGGMVLTLEGNALTDNAEIQLEVLGSGEFAWEDTPFQVASQEYLVGFGEGEQVGGITLTVPLTSTSASSGLIASLQVVPILSYAYAAWAYPDTGSPSLVGAIADKGQVTFPVVGAGRYQVLRIQSSAALLEKVDVKEPLSAPSYPQLQTGWCSTTALTDLAGYHEGAWPVGGRGSEWGESSNWFLAGKAGQPSSDGYFFHWLLKAGGYSVPEDVKESFHYGNAEVYIWNWQSRWISPVWELFVGEWYVSRCEEYAQQLFNFFQAYVEVNVWGLNGSRRPVAWGSALAGHSRLITGSDGTSLFYNDPASGSWNQTKPWATYLQEIIDSLHGGTALETEVIDTTIFHAEPRPASQRRAVLWLWEKTDNQNGSIILRRGQAGNPVALWVWDGSMGHEYGYYYEDLVGDMPVDDILGVKFKAYSALDKVDYGYSIRSISDSSYDYLVKTELFTSGAGKNVITLPDQTATVDAGGRVDFFPAGSFPIIDLEPYLYFLKFTLYQNGVVQDVKYVYFRIAPTDVSHIPWSVVLRPAFCREGPAQVHRAITAFEPGQELRLMGLNPEMNWGKFEAMVGSNTVQCWVDLSLVDTKDYMDVPILEVPPPPLLPTDTLIPPRSCSDYHNEFSCIANKACTWIFSTGRCKAK